MQIRKLTVALVAVPALVLAACGADEAPPTTEPDPAEETEETEATEETEEPEEADEPEQSAESASLECDAVEVIVPYSPGGGSDQQVRRLQPALEDALSTRFNINYQTGGDGSVGWNALDGAEPDGCTIANVVAPNIINLTLTAGEEVGFKASDFAYLGWTEYAPNMLAVGKDSEFETFEDFVAAAEENPGELTVSGVGSNGALLAGELKAATGLEFTYVPVSGGVGEMIPQLAGGHIDAAMTGASVLDGDQARPLALAKEWDEFPDIPSFEEAGYPGVTLVTSWGFIAPPGTPEPVMQTWNDAIRQALDDPEIKAAYEDVPRVVLRQDLDETRAYFEEQYEATETALEAIS